MEFFLVYFKVFGVDAWHETLKDSFHAVDLGKEKPMLEIQVCIFATAISDIPGKSHINNVFILLVDNNKCISEHFKS